MEQITMYKEVQVNTFVVSYLCDKCNEGEMIDAGVGLTQNPMLYKHQCNKCFDIQYFPVNYPAIRYEPVLPDMIGPILNKKEFFGPISIYNMLYNTKQLKTNLGICMESFKSFVNKAAIAELFKKPPKEQISWLNYDGSHTAVRKAKSNFLNYNSDFASIRKPTKDPLKEDEVSSNIKWTPWTGKRFKANELNYNKHHESYDKAHDDPQIIPGDSEDHVPAIKDYCSAYTELSEKSSSNINNHLRHLAGQKVSEGGEKTQGIIGGHAPEKVREAVKALSATFRGNANRKPIKFFVERVPN